MGPDPDADLEFAHRRCLGVLPLLPPLPLPYLSHDARDERKTGTDDRSLNLEATKGYMIGRFAHKIAERISKAVKMTALVMFPTKMCERMT